MMINIITTMIIIKDESQSTVTMHRLYTDKVNFLLLFHLIFIRHLSFDCVFVSHVQVYIRNTFVTEHNSKTCNFKPLLTRNETRNGLKGGRIISMTTAFLSSFYHRIRLCMSVYA